MFSRPWAEAAVVPSKRAAARQREGERAFMGLEKESGVR
jgi:hypothetical protein